MSVLHETLNSYDSESLDELLGFINIKPRDKSSVEKIESILEKLSEITGIPQYHGVDTLFLEFLNVTAGKVGAANIDWHTMTEREISEAIYIAYQERLRDRINGMSERKRKKLGNQLLEALQGEEMGLLKAGGGLALALGAGEAAGFALFTGTAIGMKALGTVFGVTFQFGFYQAVMFALGIAVGPLGWIAVTGIFIYGGQKKWNSVKQTRLSFVIMALIFEHQARQEYSAAVSTGGKQFDSALPIDDSGVLTKITGARYLALPEHK